MIGTQGAPMGGRSRYNGVLDKWRDWRESRKDWRADKDKGESYSDWKAEQSAIASGKRSTEATLADKAASAWNTAKRTTSEAEAADGSMVAASPLAAILPWGLVVLAVLGGVYFFRRRRSS